MDGTTDRPSVEALAAALDDFEGAQDRVREAFAHKSAVVNQVKELLGVGRGFNTDDHLMAALIRALVKSREAEREAETPASGSSLPRTET